jgi:hypothetical protein
MDYAPELFSITAYCYLSQKYRRDIDAKKLHGY